MRRPPLDDDWRLARDRVLLYAAALDLPPYEGLELAYESLSATPQASITPAMEHFFSLLEDRGRGLEVHDQQGLHISSFPPMKRGVMVAEPLDRLPWFTDLRHRLKALTSGDRQ